MKILIALLTVVTVLFMLFFFFLYSAVGIFMANYMRQYEVPMEGVVDIVNAIINYYSVLLYPALVLMLAWLSVAFFCYLRLRKGVSA